MCTDCLVICVACRSQYIADSLQDVAVLRSERIIIFYGLTLIDFLADSSVKCVNTGLDTCKFRHLSLQTCLLVCQIRRISTLFCGCYLRSHIVYLSLNCINGVSVCGVKSFYALGL